MNTSTTAAVQVAGIAALSCPQEVVQGMVAQFQRRRDVFVEEIRRLPGVECVVPRGAFYAFPDFSSFGKSDVELAIHMLRTARVSCVPGSGFGKRGSGFLRFSFVRSPEEMRSASQRIRNALAAL